MNDHIRAPIAPKHSIWTFLWVLAPVVLAFSLSQFFRSAQALLAESLRLEISASPEQLGLISGSFHFAFALMQIPVGVMLDRYGPRKTNGVMMIITVAGVLIFASAHSVAGLMIGQAVIGLGCSAAFMAALVLASRWIAPEKFAATSGLIVACSLLGVLASATPLATLIEAHGWRDVYYGLAGLSALSVVLTFAIVRDAPPGHSFHTRQGETVAQALGGMLSVWKTRQVWFLVGVAFFSYPAILTVRGLWGGPYLHDVFGISPVEVGNVLLLMTIGMILGPPAYGQVSRMAGGLARPFIIFAVAIAAILCLAQAFWGPQALWLSAVLLVAHGFLGSCATLNYAASRAAVPEHLLGRALTTVNLATFAGLFVLQGIAGVIIGQFDAGSGAGYRMMFVFLAAGLAISGTAFWMGTGRVSAKSRGTS